MVELLAKETKSVSKWLQRGAHKKLVFFMGKTEGDERVDKVALLPKYNQKNDDTFQQAKEGEEGGYGTDAKASLDEVGKQH